MTSRYLQGNFAPVDLEVSAYDLEVVGALPAELTGRYVRTGPNPLDRTELDHWFVGDGMVHGVVSTVVAPPGTATGTCRTRRSRS